MTDLNKMPIDELCINTIRTLSMDAVQKANSGHPGTPMALAPLAYVLWTKFMRHNPQNPKWFNRDRFILSNGHASMLLYSMLYLTGYDLSLDQIKNFRQWDSKTPGHPEHGLTAGVETTTGPLGQGFMNGIGMAIAEAHLAAVYNRDHFNVVDHYTYALCSDGDLMEGASHETASLAGHLGLGKLIYIYDDNHISIEGPTEITYTENVSNRFEAYHWHVQNIGENANDIEALSSAITNAQNATDKPSLIIVRSHIAYGAPNMHDTPEAHGSPLGEEEIKLTKKFYEWPENKHFLVPEKALTHMQRVVNTGKNLETEWNKKFAEYKKAYPDLAKQLEASLNNELPQGWDNGIPEFRPDDGPIATRKASSAVINGFADKIPWMVGGSADLAPSTNTLIKKSEYFSKGKYHNRNIAYGVREHGMCGINNGIILHGGLRPFGATFFIFTDYARPSIRLASLMKLPVIYVMTHDSIGLGEDGPTHQPIEHLASLRAMPHMWVIRPADANETAYAWRAAITRLEGPTMLVLTRQNLPIFDRKKYAPAEGLLKGAYIISREKGENPDIILLASGSEVQLIIEAREALSKEGIDARCVSMPSWELFQDQSNIYQAEILPPNVKARLAVEAGSPLGWSNWVGEKGDVIGITTYGASAPYKENFKHYGFTVENIVARAKEL
jgi:transketolase